jgi:hypothetical protein
MRARRRVIFACRSGTITAMPTDDPTQATKPKPPSPSPGSWLRNRAGLIILVILGAIVGLRLMSSWIKWMLIAMVGAAIVYLVKGALRRVSDRSDD